MSASDNNVDARSVRRGFKDMPTAEIDQRIFDHNKAVELLRFMGYNIPEPDIYLQALVRERETRTNTPQKP